MTSVNLGSSLLLNNDDILAQSEQASFFNTLSKMMESYAPIALQDIESKHSTMENEIVPFDSPLDQSLGSPESTRDFSPHHSYEFDFSGVEDAIMFPDHGTQEMHNDNYLASLPLFDIEHLVKQENSKQKDESDYSFDAMTTGIVPLTTTTTTTSSFNAPSPTSSIASSIESHESITQLAAVFVREYARSHPLNDIDVLLSALRVAGIAVSDQVVTDILASTSVKSASASPSPAPSPAVSMQHSFCCDHQQQHESVAPISPLIPATNVLKTRSSLQSSFKDNLVSTDTRYGKRFVCAICNKHFDRAFNLRTHAMTHIDPDDRDKPFSCPWSECSKNFSRKYDAERHYRSVHLKKGEVATKQQVAIALSGRQYEDESPSNG